MSPRIIPYHVGRECLVISNFDPGACISRPLGCQRFPRLLESMTERPMSYVMKQRGKQGDFSPRFVEFSLNSL